MPVSINRPDFMMEIYEPSKQPLNTLPQPVSDGMYQPLNMSHLQLFHHFSTVTSETLALEHRLWKEKVMPCAFQVVSITQTFNLIY